MVAKENMKDQTLAQDNNSEVSALKACALDILADKPAGFIALLDNEYRLVSAGHALTTVSGMPAAASGGSLLSEALPQLTPMIEPVLQSVLRDGQAVTGSKELFPPEIRYSRGGELFLCADYLPVRGEDGTVSGVLILQPDGIPETSEHHIRASEKHAQKILDHLATYVFVLSTDGIVLDANNLFLADSGLRLSDVLGKPLWQNPLIEESELSATRIRQAVNDARDGRPSRFDCLWNIPEEGCVTVDFQLTALRGEDGEIKRLIASARDISERIAREAQLVFSETLLRRIFEATADALILADARGRITLANARAAQMFGYSADEFAGLCVDDLLPDTMRHDHARLREGYYQQPVARSMADKRDLHGRRGDGSLFPIEVGLTPLEISGDKRVLATVIDVTAQKKFQRTLEDALKAKTALLNEVHHRVKNNLQVVSSLLSLQARGIPEEIREPFTESQGRIKAMALIHQQFYEKKQMDRIEALSYLKNLCDLLRQSYTGLTRKLRIELDSDQEMVFLTMDHALPFGLLINELVTNAIKHAFIGRNQGQIRLYLTRDDDILRLTLEDDGVGVPEHLELGQGTSLGFQLIPDLAKQLDADLVLKRGQGTRYEVDFAVGVKE
ncbi:MAG: PAS domain S-box protein [Oceanospirillaceae bacterium]|nr:PAS domain S-box protein [Oceanospirillaceae bacterium]|tara:strand:+ start:46585 stop:48435 length:1851 start_codon:yes stop_codon:yes gene_type:complete